MILNIVSGDKVVRLCGYSCNLEGVSWKEYIRRYPLSWITLEGQP